ncbi:IS4 family transposase [Sutcliffiella rhizosphaerae]|uniref:IS4 family transposase IS4Bsu1 n=1 Tax=Sutcliffiella rhizosphaerae TaxID=2880967 RepID=A0ABN8AIQ9_9BACI|nr:IS4 family transposase [Sutcliffiella rhizosphaerae]CAG9623043.1 IS4 family transposase IS4Bsu1 [Sutcliffiella rhizosphaerae]
MSNLSNISVFEKCFSKINLKNFRCPYSDTYVKKLLSGQSIMLFLDAILHKRGSLDEIAENLKANSELQDYLRLPNVSGSSLCRKLTKLPRAYLHQLTFWLLEKVRAKKGNVPVNPVFGKLGILDSTEISLPRLAGEWAYCQKDKNAIKIHMLYLVYNQETSFANRFVSSTAAVSDQEVAPSLIEDKQTTYVMDRGYINYELFQSWIKEDVFFVARIKANSRTKIIEEWEVAENNIVSRDAKVEMRVVKTEETFTARLVEYTDKENRTYRVITNRWDLKAEEVGEIYRQRWAIELFFKWIKQNLSTIHWYSYKPKAVWNQIYLTIIAYALCELVREELKATNKPLSYILKKVRCYWFHPWDYLVEGLHKPPRKKKGKPGRPRKHKKKLKAVKFILSDFRANK